MEQPTANLPGKCPGVQVQGGGLTELGICPSRANPHLRLRFTGYLNTNIITYLLGGLAQAIQLREYPEAHSCERWILCP